MATQIGSSDDSDTANNLIFFGDRMIHTKTFSPTITAFFITLLFFGTNPSVAQTTGNSEKPWLNRKPNSVRFASFNIAMNRRKEGQLKKELESGKSQHAIKISKIIQAVRPDVLLLCEIDRDDKEETLKLLNEIYLQKNQGESKAIHYKYSYFAQSNTGIPSKVDLDGDGKSDGLGDAYGFGQFPGKYAMAVLSKFPISKKDIRTYQKMLWKDMPGANLPKKENSDESYYSAKALNHFRLSSKSHWVLPINTPAGTIYFVTAHPTPPVFDGPEDRNGLRNFDEIRLIADLIHPEKGKYLVDDRGKKGGLPTDSLFVIAGDMNADPLDGDSSNNAASQLLNHPLVLSTPTPSSKGGTEASELQKGVNSKHRGNPKFDTADFNDRQVGNLRLDYVLPSKTLKVTGCGVFWPTESMKEYQWARSSDHRLVWVDVIKAAK